MQLLLIQSYLDEIYSMNNHWVMSLHRGGGGGGGGGGGDQRVW